jgi:hypothetical protein
MDETREPESIKQGDDIRRRRNADVAASCKLGATSSQKLSCAGSLAADQRPQLTL